MVILPLSEEVVYQTLWMRNSPEAIKFRASGIAV
jgi:hypothetical protein